jgi:hypothetical protein
LKDSLIILLGDRVRLRDDVGWVGVAEVVVVVVVVVVMVVVEAGGDFMVTQQRRIEMESKITIFMKEQL